MRRKAASWSAAVDRMDRHLRRLSAPSCVLVDVSSTCTCKDNSSWERCMAVQEPQQPSRLSFRVANGRPFHLDVPATRPPALHAVRALRRALRALPRALGYCWCTCMIHISNTLTHGAPSTLCDADPPRLRAHNHTEDTHAPMDTPKIRAKTPTRGALGAPPARLRHACHVCHRSARRDRPVGRPRGGHKLPSHQLERPEKHGFSVWGGDRATWARGRRGAARSAARGCRRPPAARAPTARGAAGRRREGRRRRISAGRA